MACQAACKELTDVEDKYIVEWARVLDESDLRIKHAEIVRPDGRYPWSQLAFQVANLYIVCEVRSAYPDDGVRVDFIRAQPMGKDTTRLTLEDANPCTIDKALVRVRELAGNLEPPVIVGWEQRPKRRVHSVCIIL